MQVTGVEVCIHIFITFQTLKCLYLSNLFIFPFRAGAQDRRESAVCSR